MTNDPTENLRRALQTDLNEAELEREGLEKRYGKVWDTPELIKEFEVIGFLAPYASVRKRSNGEKGTVLFQHHPRYYFEYKAD